MTSEDWKGVLVGVGASSALSFRYDLWSVRTDRSRSACRAKTSSRSRRRPACRRTPRRGGEELARSTPARSAATPAPRRRRRASRRAAREQYSSTASTRPSRRRPTRAAAARSRAWSRDKQDRREARRRHRRSRRRPRCTATQTAITDEQGLLHDRRSAAGQLHGDVLLRRHRRVERGERRASRDEQGRAGVRRRSIRAQSRRARSSRSPARAPTIDPTRDDAGHHDRQELHQEHPGARPHVRAALGAAAGSQRRSDGFAGRRSRTSLRRRRHTTAAGPRAPPSAGRRQARRRSRSVIAKTPKDVVIESHGAPRPRGERSAREAVRNKLVDDGVPAKRIHVVPQARAGEAERVRVLAVAPGAKRRRPRTAARDRARDDVRHAGRREPLHGRPPDDRARRHERDGRDGPRRDRPAASSICYDPISERGDKRFAFKAVRLDNPTDDTLEPGPVTVYGDGRFIGEGITEPVPPKAIGRRAVRARQADRRRAQPAPRTIGSRSSMTVQRGIVTAEVQHRRDDDVHDHEPARPSRRTVYLRHRLESRLDAGRRAADVR